MIDYERLKIAHELADKYSNICADRIVSVCIDINVGTHINYVIRGVSGLMFVAEDINDLIAKLKELTHPDEPKPKYKDAWFVSSHNNIVCTKVENQEGYIYCDETNHDALGKNMYPSREALIESQIEYWNKLRYPTIEESSRVGSQQALDSMGKIIECQKRIDLLYKSVIKECDHQFIHISEAMAYCIKCKYELKLCQHESDGMSFEMPPYPHKYRCIKCGEFYK